MNYNPEDEEEEDEEGNEEDDGEDYEDPDVGADGVYTDPNGTN
jgi:hypothetical protein